MPIGFDDGKFEICANFEGKHPYFSSKHNGSCLGYNKSESRLVNGVQMRAVASSSTTSLSTATDDKICLTKPKGEGDSLPHTSYWSTENADVISKWLFPATFAVWNFLYFILNYHMAGRC